MMRRSLVIGAAAMAAAFGGSVPAAAGDGLDEFAAAVVRFRGVGYADITSYRVRVDLPEDPEGEGIPLEEFWRAPSELALRAANPSTPRAIVRGLAIYLEPLYVARASLLAADLESSIARIRESCAVHSSTEEGLDLTVGFPVTPNDDLPAELADLVSLEAGVDGEGRLVRLDLETRDGQTLRLRCRYEGTGLAQPSRAVWELPRDERIEIVTTYATRDGRRLPATRHLTFPSPYDPGETEEILVRYSDWVLGAEVPDEVFAPGASFRYDGNGLVAD